MSHESMPFARPARLVMPRGSAWLAAAVALLIDGLRRLDRWQLSQQPDEPRNAEEVLAWADRIEQTEARFATDLRAAALRADVETPASSRH